MTRTFFEELELAQKDLDVAASKSMDDFARHFQAQAVMRPDITKYESFPPWAIQRMSNLSLVIEILCLHVGELESKLNKLCDASDSHIQSSAVPKLKCVCCEEVKKIKQTRPFDNEVDMHCCDDCAVAFDKSGLDYFQPFMWSYSKGIRK